MKFYQKIRAGSMIYLHLVCYTQELLLMLKRLNIVFCMLDCQGPRKGGQFRLAEPHNHHYALMQMHSGQVGFVDSTSPYQSCRSISSAPCLQFRAF